MINIAVRKPTRAPAPARRTPAPARAADVLALLAQAAAQPVIALPHRATLEARFGRRLDQIAVYAGPLAQVALALLHAEAFTHQGAIFLADPHPPLEVVAHEVVHVLQMRSGAFDADPQPGAAAIVGKGAGWSADGAVQHEALIVPATAPAEREATLLAAQAQCVTATPLAPPLAVTTTLPPAAVALRRAATPAPPTNEPAAETFRRAAERERRPAAPVPETPRPVSTPPPAPSTAPPTIEPDQPPFELPPAPAPGVSEADVAAREAEQDQAAAALAAAEGPEALMVAFAAAPPTIKAQHAATLSSETNRLAKEEQAAFSAELPDLHAELNTQVETPLPLVVSPPDARPLDLDVEGALPRVELPPTPDPGRYTANDRVTADVSRLLSGEADDRAASLATQLRAVQTSDASVATSPGAPPRVPLIEGADPAQL
ncbi:MAG: DUF4157 domain-containing protein, partial [Chloroflexus sp.]